MGDDPLAANSCRPAASQSWRRWRAAVMTIATDEITQKVDWRMRVSRAVLERQFDQETLLALLDAGWEQAHSEGVTDAAHICQRIADQAPSPRDRQIAQLLADSCTAYDQKNRADRRS